MGEVVVLTILRRESFQVRDAPYLDRPGSRIAGPPQLGQLAEGSASCAIPGLRMLIGN